MANPMSNIAETCLLKSDLTANIKLRAIKGDGFHTWTDDEIAQFKARTVAP